jgi:hypothetical protein
MALRPRAQSSFRCCVLLSNLDHGGFHSFKNLEIPGAAAEDAGERGANLIASCLRILVQQGFRCDKNRGRAITALGGAKIGEGVLQRVKFSFDAEAFDGQNISRVALDSEDQAGEHRFTIEKNGASAAFAEFAAVFGAGVAEIFAKNFKQGFVGCERDVDLFSVQGDSNVRSFLGFGW